MVKTPTYDELPQNERNAIDHWIKKQDAHADPAKHLTGAAPIRPDITNPQVMANLREGHARNFNNPEMAGARETIMGAYSEHLSKLVSQMDSTKIEGLGFGSQGVAPQRGYDIAR